MIKLELPFPPSDNHYHVVQRGKKRVSDKGKLFQDDVYYIVHQMRVKNKLQNIPLEGRLKVKVLLTPPKLIRTRDIFNYMKALWDSLEIAEVYKNDSQIDKGELERGPPEGLGMTAVWITEIGVANETVEEMRKRGVL